ncbi:uncharacterized protein LOC133736985 isoform X5 [Rosa rugosa]|uniref:uncharacterized protein LOC133736985 isoform X5 n=1 Tax=Rosa rugosa TaxID=74645 RepID=UPI002B401459|nr:uncharacterized protein LOC133736985 isoform X5 [Rosa rugosa]
MESEFCNSGWVLWIHQEKPKSWYLIQELLFPRQHSGENVNKYLENYEMAFTGFETAALKDPGLNATEEVQKIVNLLDKLDNLLRGHARSKRLASLASSLAVVNCEIFGGIEIASEENDGEVLMGLLGGCESCVSNVVSRIKGPWAIIYWLVTFEWLVCEDITYWGSRGYCHSS